MVKASKRELSYEKSLNFHFKLDLYVCRNPSPDFVSSLKLGHVRWGRRKIERKKILYKFMSLQSYKRGIEHQRVFFFPLLMELEHDCILGLCQVTIDFQGELT